MIVIDASVWIGYFIPQDVHHQPSRIWLRQYSRQGGQFVVPTIMLAEVGGGIARRMGQPALAQRIINGILRLSRLQVVDVDRQLGLAATQLATTLQIRGADAVYVAVAQQYNIPLVTWDQEQLTRAAGVIQVRTP